MKSLHKLGLSFIGPILLIVILTMPIGPLAGGLGILQPIGGIFDVGRGIDDRSDHVFTVPELSEQVQVIMDEWLVPHIYASSVDDAFLILGYLHARDRLFQITMQKYLASGRISEIVGGASWAINSDKYYRTIGLARSAQITYEGYVALESSNPDVSYVLSIIRAYATGVNKYLTSMSSPEIPIEFRVLGFSPEPWKPVDIFIWSKMMAWGLSGGFESDLTMNYIRNAFDNQTMYQELFPETMPYAVPIIPEQYNLSLSEYPGAPAGWSTVPDEYQLLQYNDEGVHYDTSKMEAILEFASQVPSLFGESDFVGSNSWAVHGSLTSTGSPLLANDPHLVLQLPSLWYEAHIVVPGELNVQGGTLAGTPAVLIGHNEYISWGLTNVGLDVLDLFIERVNPLDNDQYEYNGEWRPFDIINEDILIRGGSIVEYSVKWSVHGPCIDSLVQGYDWGDNGPVNLAMNWTGSGVTHEIIAISKLNRAQNITDYFDALYWWDSPPHNFIYADHQGNIALTVAGRFPIRSGYSGRYPVMGLNDSVGWAGSVPYAHVPRSVNPTQGYLQSANQLSIDPELYGYKLLGPQADPYRARRIDSLLNSHDSFSVEDMMRYQADILDVSAQSMLPIILSAWTASGETNSTIQSIVDILTDWDYIMDENESAPTIWTYLEESMKHEVFDELESRNLSPNYARTPVLEWILREEISYYIDDYSTPEVESLESIVVRALHRCIHRLVSTVGNSETHWIYGLHHILYIEHLAGFTHLGGEGHPGSRYTLNAASGWIIRGGPSRRMVVSFGDPNEFYSVYPGGQSGNMFSKHWSDLFDLWNGYDAQRKHYGYMSERFYASVIGFPSDEARQLLVFNPGVLA